MAALESRFGAEAFLPQVRAALRESLAAELSPPKAA
jgi:hypothetical protein